MISLGLRPPSAPPPSPIGSAEVVSEWSAAVGMELDFEKEAANLREVTDNLKSAGLERGEKHRK